MWRLLIVFVFLPCVVVAETRVVYPAPESPQDRRFDDVRALLQGALERTVDDYGPFHMEPVAESMSSTRYARELEQGRVPNVIWTSTSIERESALLPIRIPLRRGLLSYRIGLIHQDGQPRLSAMRTIEDLQALTFVQGIGWGDVDVYRANGIAVETAQYESQFRMVQAGRVDMFPRGVGEVFAEFEARAEQLPGLSVERDLLLYYPWPYYLFVAPDNQRLAERLEVGLRRMIADGSFEEIFQRYHGADIARARLNERHVIHLHNPLLPTETPLDDATLWFYPDGFVPKAEH